MKRYVRLQNVMKIGLIEHSEAYKKFEVMDPNMFGVLSN